MKVSTFFTWFWIFYYPTCVGFNDLPSMGYVDEFMTVILIGYTITQYGRRTDNTCVEEALAFLGILIFYILYSLLMAVNVADSVWLDLVQQIRPYSVIYCTWILSPRFTQRQVRMMLISMILTLGAWIMYHPVGGDAEFPVLGQLAITTGMSYYLFTKATKRNRYIALLLVCTGLLAPKMKFVGEVVVFIALIFFVQKKIRFSSLKSQWKIAMVAVIAIFFTWERFKVYFVDGWENEELARPRTYKTSLKILRDYFPFGSGMGTFATNAAWKYYSPLYPKYGLDEVWGLDRGGGFIADAYYPSLAEFGVVGVFLFCVFWKRRIKQIYQLKDGRLYRVAMMATACLAIEQTADSSYLSGKGMGYFMLLGLCMASLRYQKEPVKISIENKTKNESNDGGLREGERGGCGIGHPNDGANVSVERV